MQHHLMLVLAALAASATSIRVLCRTDEDCARPGTGLEPSVFFNCSDNALCVPQKCTVESPTLACSPFDQDTYCNPTSLACVTRLPLGAPCTFISAAIDAQCTDHAICQTGSCVAIPAIDFAPVPTPMLSLPSRPDIPVIAATPSFSSASHSLSSGAIIGIAAGAGVALLAGIAASLALVRWRSRRRAMAPPPELVGWRRGCEDGAEFTHVRPQSSPPPPYKSSHDAMLADHDNNGTDTEDDDEDEGAGEMERRR